MRKVKIPKGNGKFRTIYIPTKKHRKRLRRQLPTLYDKADNILNHEVVHGFMPGKSIITHAQRHVGKAFTLEFDLKDFFDWCDYAKLKNKLTEKQCRDLLFDGAARQGLPTSPILANIAAIELDNNILSYIGEMTGVVYTRYADNLAFSFDNESYIAQLGADIPNIVAKCQFKINKSKTKLQFAKSGRRMITGIAVGDTDIHVPRRIKRKLRAALHQGNEASAKGLQEFSKLKRISLNHNFAQKLKEVQSLIKTWRIKDFHVKQVPEKRDDIQLTENVIITGDPVYLLGMSNWFSNFRTCWAHPNGSYRRMAAFWARCPNVRLAIWLSGNRKRCGTVVRPSFLARALIFETSQGWYWTQLNGPKLNELRDVLRANQIRHIAEYNGATVLIHTGVPIKKPYGMARIGILPNGTVRLI